MENEKGNKILFPCICRAVHRHGCYLEHPDIQDHSCFLPLLQQRIYQSRFVDNDEFGAYQNQVYIEVAVFHSLSHSQTHAIKMKPYQSVLSTNPYDAHTTESSFVYHPQTTPLAASRALSESWYCRSHSEDHALFCRLHI